MLYDLIIIGAGAAGLSAALYAGRYRLKTLLLSREFGGETTIAGKIENYPGLHSIEGHLLMKTMQEQAEEAGAKLIAGEVAELKKENSCFLVWAGNKKYRSRALLLALGAGRKRLALPKEQELTGKGIHYCALCDGPLYRGKRVAVVGGGDTAVKEALFLADWAKKVFLIVRGKMLKAEPINLEKLRKRGKPIEILWRTGVKSLIGQKTLQAIELTNPQRQLSLDGLFVAIGHQPLKELPRRLGIKLDQAGYIKVDTKMQTSLPGVFAAGDATNFFGDFKQDITAAATGAVAATSAYEYLKGRGRICHWHAKPKIEKRMRH